MLRGNRRYDRRRCIRRLIVDHDDTQALRRIILPQQRLQALPNIGGFIVPLEQSRRAAARQRPTAPMPGQGGAEVRAA